MSAPMLIAQISDTHLRADGTALHGRIDTQAALAAGIAHIAGFDPAPDLVLATGDLTDLSRSDDFRMLRAMLDRLPMPVFVIPGNHDRRDRVRATFADRGYLPVEGEFLHYVLEDWPLRLIGLDTVIEGEVSGRMCAARLAWLSDRLDEAPDRPTLIFMHHPPFPSGIVFLDEPPFEGATGMEALIRRHPQVRQIICGHIHRAMHLGWAGTCAAVAPSAAYQMNLAFVEDQGLRKTPDPAAITLYRWADGRGPTGYHSTIPPLR